MAEVRAEIGVIGGSGVYSLMRDMEEIDLITRRGRPSDSVSIGKIAGRDVAFIPRHARRHGIPPHRVPYSANLQALKDLGVNRIIATSAIGSLRKDYRPGDFVIFDQFVNMTHGREDTIFDTGNVAHVGMAEPYCPELRGVCSKALDKLGIPHHDTGTILVINGPRFSTKAESRFFSANKMDVINMTQYPEVALAREHGICYLGIGVVTDYDVGMEGEDMEPVSFDQIGRMISENSDKLNGLITEIIPDIPAKASCGCANSLSGSTATI